MKTRLLAGILLAAGAAFGANAEFDRVVKAIENQYGVQRTHIPLVGAANFFVKVIRPAGVSGFKLAVFENLHTSYREQEQLDGFMDGLAARDLHPLIRVHSRRDGESTYILTGEIGKTTKILIITFERNEATVIQVNANMETLLRTIDAPGEARHSLTGTR